MVLIRIGEAAGCVEARRRRTAALLTNRRRHFLLVDDPGGHGAESSGDCRSGTKARRL
jgi:hypothetical protein